MEPYAATGMAIAAVLIGFIVFVLVFQLIWNWTVPAVFGLKRITFFQALGILILASILTGGHRIVSTDVTGALPKRSHAPAASASLG
jgi:hypothetical protein